MYRNTAILSPILRTHPGDEIITEERHHVNGARVQYIPSRNCDILMCLVISRGCAASVTYITTTKHVTRSRVSRHHSSSCHAY